MQYTVDRQVEVAVHSGQTGRGCSTQWTDIQIDVAVHNGQTDMYRLQYTVGRQVQYTMDRQVEVVVYNGQTGRGCSTQGRGYSTQVRKRGRSSIAGCLEPGSHLYHSISVVTETVIVTSRLQAIFNL